MMDDKGTYILLIIVLAGDVGLFDFCRTSEVFSLNAAVFAAVCLASRLSSSLHAFVTVVSSVVLFVLLPQFRRYLQVSIRTNVCVCVCLPQNFSSYCLCDTS